jgi:hypothetical protein
LSRDELIDKTTHRQIIQCVEAMRGPLCELVAAEIPPIVIADVFFALLLETSDYNAEGISAIISEVLHHLRTAGTN